MRFRKIIKLFEDGNVCVTGLRGRGKDMLIANVVARRKLPYISNVDYDGDFHPLKMSDLDCGKNTYRNFISGDVRYYRFPYADGTDVYISDAGVYFPSQYCNELNKEYPYIATYGALCRHTSLANVHVNVQYLGRVYDKIREQCDQFVLCLGMVHMLGFVIQGVRIYDDPESCKKKIKPFPVRVPIFASAQVRYNVKLQKAMYEANHGIIKNGILIYRNKSHYNTRIFRDILASGRKDT